ncbi:facilitated trehalose transporter Tret1-like isoform X2 [Plodia interpunctella]|uniref:facilitated trehalose transporter Tret1-like isoform X2 n=1 Tax=Plodia interpunctella TaxID=58824 RepID=UPI002368AD68|nr:facilitated trehalose transporter Tret1-like isoform X2 [Plodia interpunctella]
MASSDDDDDDTTLLIRQPQQTNKRNDSTPFIKNGSQTNGATIAKTPEKPPLKKDSKAGRGVAWRQVLACFLANLGTINTGMAFGFSATSLPQMKDPNSTVHINDDQAGWIASLSAAGTPVGCIVSGYMMDSFGRKLTLVLTEVPLICGWLLIAVAQNVPMIYVGRLLVGFGSGMVGAPARVYTAEVSQPHLRGMLGALASVGVSTGVLIQYVIGSMTTWNVLAGISASIPILSFLTMMFLPETPNYLLQQDKRERAESSLAKLRGGSCDLQEEIQRMITFKEKNHVEPLKSPKEIFKAVIAPSALKPFLILALYFLIYQWCGINTITFYAIEIFQASGSTMSKTTFAISLGIVRLIFTVVGCVLCRRFGRRPLTFVSSVGCSVTMVTLAVYMYFVKVWHENEQEPALSWLPPACIYLFVISCTIGYLIVPWVMIGEVYPTQVRGVIGGMTTCAAHLSVFSVVKTFPQLRSLIDFYGAFALYGAITIFGTIFFYFCLPETKGRTLQEIEDYFCGRTKTLKKQSITSTA